MSDLRTAANQMLEALEGGADSWQLVGPAIDALKEALAEPEPCRYPDCVDNGPDGKCTRWLLDECSMREDYKRYRPAKPLPPIGKASTYVGVSVQEPPVVARNVLLGMIASRPAQQAEPFSPEAISTTQTAWKMGYEAGKAERVEQSFEQAGVVTSMVKGGVTWHIWPDQMPDGTTLYAAAPIIKPEIKDDNSVPQAQQFLYNAWADEQIQKEKK